MIFRFYPGLQFLPSFVNVNRSEGMKNRQRHTDLTIVTSSSAKAYNASIGFAERAQYLCASALHRSRRHLPLLGAIIDASSPVRIH